MSIERGDVLNRALLSSLGGNARRLRRTVVIVPGELAVRSDVSDQAVPVVALVRRSGGARAVRGRRKEHGAAVGVHVGGCHGEMGRERLPFGLAFVRRR